MPSPPIIVLCGWLAANPRHVGKYADMYESLGYKIFTIYSSPLDLFTPVSTAKWNEMQEFNKWLHEEGIDGVLTIVPHILSNGGCWSWYCFENQLVLSGVNFHVERMILDSAPSMPHAHETAPAAFTATIKNKLLRQFMIVLLSVVLTLHTWALHSFGYEHPVELQFHRVIERDALIPKLFMYSNGDIMIPASHIEYAIQRAKTHQTPITSVHFQGSKHVAHLSHNPRLYIKSIQSFLGEPMTPNSSAPYF